MWAALLVSEMKLLPDLAGYLKLAATPHWRRVLLRMADFPPRETL